MNNMGGGLVHEVLPPNENLLKLMGTKGRKMSLSQRCSQISGLSSICIQAVLNGICGFIEVM